MPWDLPISVLTGFANPVTTWVISSNQTDLNLFEYIGEQPEVLEYDITVSAGVDIDTMEFGPFPNGCIINFTLLGRIRGRGGLGGQGAWADGEPDPSTGPAGWGTGSGTAATSGEDALTLSSGITVRIDADEGYIWGGGGGGAGGRGIVDNDGFASAGGGGGGGRGWNVSPGGAGGIATGIMSQSGQDGTDGTALVVGSGGATTSVGGTVGSPGGGGGEWGVDGSPVLPPSSGNANGIYVTSPATTFGLAGKAINVNGATLQFVGVKGEATLITEGRLRGAAA